MEITTTWTAVDIICEAEERLGVDLTQAEAEAILIEIEKELKEAVDEAADTVILDAVFLYKKVGSNEKWI